MKRASILLAALFAVATLIIWASGGFHTGWTQTSIPVTGVDEITGIEYVTHEDGFIAGLDVLAAGLGLSFLTLTLSVVVQKMSARSHA